MDNKIPDLIDDTILREWFGREVDYLNDYQYLTFLGRYAGMTDDEIRETNKQIANNPDLLLKIYDEDGFKRPSV